MKKIFIVLDHEARKRTCDRTADYIIKILIFVEEVWAKSHRENAD